MNSAKWVLGSELNRDDQQHCLAAFVHRLTRQHKPQWANKPWKDGKPYPVQYDSDAEWLNTTRFAVRKDGRLDRRVQRCESNPTWPHYEQIEYSQRKSP